MRHLSSYLPRAALIGFACLAGSATPTFADIPVGTLQCEVSAGVGMVVASTRTLNCVYHPQRGRAQRYTGRIDRIGLDLGATAAESGRKVAETIVGAGAPAAHVEQLVSIDPNARIREVVVRVQ